MTLNQIFKLAINLAVVGGLGYAGYIIYQYVTAPDAPHPPQPQPADYTALASAYNLMSGDLENVEENIDDMAVKITALTSAINRIAVNAAMTLDTTNRIEQDILDGVPIDW